MCGITTSVSSKSIAARVVFGERDRVTAVFGFQYRIAESLEELANHPA